MNITNPFSLGALFLREQKALIFSGRVHAYAGTNTIIGSTGMREPE